MAKVFGWLPDKYSEMWSLIAYGCLVITGRNEVVAKVIFLHLSVIHSVHRGGGGLPQCMLPPPPWTRQTPLDQADPPGPGRPPQTRQTPPRTRQTPPDQADAPQTRQTPWTRQTPPQTRQTPTPPRPGRPPREADSSIWSTSGRYASYWNAFLF